MDTRREKWLNEQDQIRIDEIRTERNKDYLRRIFAVVKIDRERIVDQVLRRIEADRKRGISADTSIGETGSRN